MASWFCHSSMLKRELVVGCAATSRDQWYLHGHGLGCGHWHRPVVWCCVWLLLVELDDVTNVSLWYADAVAMSMICFDISTTEALYKYCIDGQQ